MNHIVFTSERKDDGWGGWSRNAKVGDQEYRCIVARGKAVRIPYKPRGQNRGFKWSGSVYRLGTNAGHVWSGTVSGSIGVKGLLEEAGVFEDFYSNDRLTNT